MLGCACRTEGAVVVGCCGCVALVLRGPAVLFAALDRGTAGTIRFILGPVGVGLAPVEARIPGAGALIVD